MMPDQAQAASAAFPVPMITAFDAILSALRHRQISRIVLLTPYPQAMADDEADTLGRHGIMVTGYATLNLEDGYSRIEPTEVKALLRRIGSEAVKHAQAIVLSCTGWPTFGLAEDLAQDLGMVVISSNQAIVTDALTLGDNS